MTDSKPMALALGAALLAVVASPVRQSWRSDKVDGFPLSYYPMFSARRDDRGHVVHVLADYPDGSTRNVPYGRLGSGGFNQVRRQVARRGTWPGGADELAREVLSGLADDPEPPTGVRVVRSTFRYDDFFSGQREPLRVRVLGQAGGADGERSASSVESVESVESDGSVG